MRACGLQKRGRSAKIRICDVIITVVIFYIQLGAAPCRALTRRLRLRNNPRVNVWLGSPVRQSPFHALLLILALLLQSVVVGRSTAGMAFSQFEAGVSQHCSGVGVEKGHSPANGSSRHDCASCALCAGSGLALTPPLLPTLSTIARDVALVALDSVGGAFFIDESRRARAPPAAA